MDPEPGPLPPPVLRLHTVSVDPSLYRLTPRTGLLERRGKKEKDVEEDGKEDGVGECEEEYSHESVCCLRVCVV